MRKQAVLPYSAERCLAIRRPADNGGDLTFADGASLRESFGSGALHPGDLKPAARDAVNALLERVRTAVAASAELKKAEKEVEKVAKRLMKKK